MAFRSLSLLRVEGFFRILGQSGQDFSKCGELREVMGAAWERAGAVKLKEWVKLGGRTGSNEGD